MGGSLSTGRVVADTIAWVYDGDQSRNPFLPVAVECLVNAGHAVTVLDRGTRQSARVRLAMGGRLLSGLRFVAVGLWRLLRLRPRVIIVSRPTDAALGWPAARLLRSRLVYYPFEVFGEQHYAVPRILRAFEVQLLKRGVDAVITQNQQRANIYATERGARVPPAIVHNFKPARAVRPSGKLRARLGLPPECRIALYEGRLIEGRGLDRLVRAARHLAPLTRLVFMGEDEPWWSQRIQQWLRDPLIAGKVSRAPWVPLDEVAEYAADADVGVIIYDDAVRNNVYCEPGKLSDFVLAGVPVVVPDFPTVAPIVREYRIGAVFPGRAEPETLAATIESVLAQPRESWAGPMARARAALVWETQVPEFLRTVTGVSAR